MVTSQRLFLGFMALLVLERLYELYLSQRNARLAFERNGVETGRGHYRVMVLFHTLFLVAGPAEVLLLARPFPGALGGLALGLALGAQALRYWCIWALGPAWNSRIIVVEGEEPVTRGPYRFLPHPNYVAVQVEMAAVPLIHGAWLTALVFSLGNLWLLSVRIRAEEEALGPGWRERFRRGRRPPPRDGEERGDEDEDGTDEGGRHEQ